MKFITIKSLVSISNLIIYLLFILTFLSWGINDIDKDTVIKTDYFFIIFAVVLFVLYHFLRYRELKKTEFQLTRRHIIWMYIFYCGQYLCLLLSLLYVILTKTVMNAKGISIYFEAGFPIVFIVTTLISILESVIRAEERLFVYKKTWQESEQWNKEHLNENNDSPFVKTDAELDETMPSVDALEKKEKNLIDDDAKKDNPFA